MSRIFVDEELIDRLSKLLDEKNLTEIEIKQGFKVIRVSRGLRSGFTPDTTIMQTRLKEDNILEKEKTDTQVSGSVTAPMVGTLYHRPSPDSPEFISVGDKINKGDVIFIIEAMKTMNQVKAPHSGEVKKILLDDGSPVEYGEVLAIID